MYYHALQDQYIQETYNTLPIMKTENRERNCEVLGPNKEKKEKMDIIGRSEKAFYWSSHFVVDLKKE